MHIASADLPPSQRAWTSTEHVPSDSLGRLRTSDALPFVFYEEDKTAHSSIGRSASASLTPLTQPRHAAPINGHAERARQPRLTFPVSARFGDLISYQNDRKYDAFIAGNVERAQ